MATMVRKKKKPDEEKKEGKKKVVEKKQKKEKISPRFYTQEGAMSTPSSTKGEGVLTAREIAEYKRKAKAKKKKR